MVDDDESFRTVMALVLESNGFKVYAANGGHEAWKIFQQQMPDLIITAGEMRNGSGVELLQQILKLQPDFPIIFIVSGYDDVSGDGFTHLSLKSILQKPFKNDALISEVRKCLAI